MGFPSPAGDYVEQRFSPASMCITNTSRILETSSGYAVIEPCTRLVQNQVLLILSGGRTQFARVMGRALICDDGEAIEGSAAEEVEVLGRVTWLVNRTRDDEAPVM
ncbi:TPA: hypothetical protein QCI12_003922 [Enterobacter roggenkampii]|uniref:hypothetical protein n=1 Tax=Enterobacter roggenkampii TaxID=1812935 RepID=UPI00190C32F2|nr:hypothetical protein [Enterobacter roggenkampii]MBK4125822.1 hypothetical protein [Enterobacter roggenkampii]MBW4236276.1 hypothetical protein [Enterobacter roggenkampii]HCR1930165.1 hypothetical protein [Enterobacter roggenkampii]HDR2533698.1 hypothetical protein [Enterobacter roggenkampii]